MIYRINGKYYVKVGSQYREIKLEVKNNELQIIKDNMDLFDKVVLKLKSLVEIQ